MTSLTLDGSAEGVMVEHLESLCGFDGQWDLISCVSIGMNRSWSISVSTPLQFHISVHFLSMRWICSLGYLDGYGHWT